MTSDCMYIYSDTSSEDMRIAYPIELFDGPAKDISDLWRILGRPVKDGGYISGTIIKPKLGLRPEPFAEAAYQFWMGGDFTKNDEPQGNQVFAPVKKTIPLVYDAMKRAMDETGEAKLFSMNITADDHYEMCACADFALETFGPDADKLFPGWRDKLGVKAA